VGKGVWEGVEDDIGICLRACSGVVVLVVLLEFLYGSKNGVTMGARKTMKFM
jgi:hypothetical protein